MSNIGPRRNEREDEADAFARELLMPRKAVKENFKRTFGSESLPLWSSKVREVVGREAENSGASRLRATTRLLAKYASGGSKPLNELFGVSVEAMARRLEELGLVY
jgi:Zn-dependent peptidase ImmA (M78 family)